MAKKVSKEKFIDALTYDWEMDFMIENVKGFFHLERAYDSNKKVYIAELWDWRDEKNAKCLIKKEYAGESNHLNEFLDLKIPNLEKTLREYATDISMEFETLSK